MQSAIFFIFEAFGLTPLTRLIQSVPGYEYVCRITFDQSLQPQLSAHYSESHKESDKQLVGYDKYVTDSMGAGKRALMRPILDRLFCLFPVKLAIF